MSRTYRKRPSFFWHGNHTYYSTDYFDGWAFRDYYGFTNGFEPKTIYGGKQRDSNSRIPKSYKKMNRRIEKAKAKDAMRRENYDNIPKFRKSDEWNWF